MTGEQHPTVRSAVRRLRPSPASIAAAVVPLSDRTVMEPTGKAFELPFSTIARWWDGKIVEEYLKYDTQLDAADRPRPRRAGPTAIAVWRTAPWLQLPIP